MLATRAHRGNPKLESTYIQRNPGAPPSRQTVRIQKVPVAKSLLFTGLMLALAVLLAYVALGLVK